ncbi:peptidyl-tRNA hydrolase [Lysobacter capsici]|uniref:peptidyl-tRNA hydrolase n=1 Tax=Lysobacter capsici TaxID=435897 RepID=UPI001C9DE9B6|nr:peptidyl-tRNA hydrolase [Lysobacter capsici]
MAAPLQIAAVGAPVASAPQRPFDFMKMYILVRDDIPLGFAMVAVAHASLAGYLKFRDTPEVARWLDGPFFKAVCKVNATEFDNAKQVADHVVLTESALDGREVAIMFKPREEWPKMFKFLRLYREAPAIA